MRTSAVIRFCSVCPKKQWFFTRISQLEFVWVFDCLQFPKKSTSIIRYPTFFLLFQTEHVVCCCNMPCREQGPYRVTRISWWYLRFFFVVLASGFWKPIRTKEGAAALCCAELSWFGRSWKTQTSWALKQVLKGNSVPNWAMEQNPGCLGDLLGITLPLYRDYNKPLQGSLLNSRYNRK